MTVCVIFKFYVGSILISVTRVLIQTPQDGNIKELLFMLPLYPQH